MERRIGGDLLMALALSSARRLVPSTDTESSALTARNLEFYDKVEFLVVDV